MEDHVLIRGFIFRAEEKAPFVKSGESIYGAVEYCMATDRLKCHECGVLFASLGNHIGHDAHDMDVREYKAKHGLRLQTSLVSVGARSARSTASIKRASGNIAALRQKNPTRFKNQNKVPTRNVSEAQNQKTQCQAQLEYKINRFAKRLGRTPTTEELRSIGIGISVMCRTFRVSTIREVMLAVGLEPRLAGIRPISVAA